MGICAKVTPDAPTAGEIALSKASIRDNNRLVTKGIPLEAFQVEESLDPNVRRALEGVMSGRGNADTAAFENQGIEASKMAALQSGSTLSSANNMSSISDGSIIAGEGQAKANVAGATTARNIQDKMRMTSLQTGAGFAQNADAGLRAYANITSTAQQNKMKAQFVKDQGRSQMLGSVFGGAMGLGLKAYNNRDKGFGPVLEQDLNTNGNGANNYYLGGNFGPNAMMS